jgi:hypothetical protein
VKQLQNYRRQRNQLRNQSHPGFAQLSTNSLSSQHNKKPQHARRMSYYFAIIGTQDNPLFEYEFGTAKQGGDGVARFAEQARHMNQFIVHSSLDIVEEVQWGTGQMYTYPNFHYMV